MSLPEESSGHSPITAQTLLNPRAKFKVGALLKVDNLAMRFGGLHAVNGVSFKVSEKHIVSLIGPNGAGKTTVFNCLSGFYRPTSGSITFNGEAIEGLSSYQIARKGLLRTFQNVRLFKQMTAFENLLVAQHLGLNSGFLSGLLKTADYRAREVEAMQRASDWLKRMDLSAVSGRPAGTLAYGQQRRLEIARCMIARPKLLLLDEPAAGLNPRETEDLKQLLGELRDNDGMTLLLIEHDMKLVMSISDHIVVINQGMPLAAGTAEEIKTNADVIKAYLGES